MLNDINYILDHLKQLFPNAHCELIYHNLYELSVATILSAQTTDKAVNKITPQLFSKYPTVKDMALASVEDVYQIIKPLGLAKNKSNNIVKFASEVCEKHQGQIPSDFEQLTALSGIGRKTANVIMVEGFKIPRLPVDTHIERVSKRLGLVDEQASVLEVEKQLMKLISENSYHQGHHLLLFFGRYHCTAKKPLCNECFYQNQCHYYLATKTPSK